MLRRVLVFVILLYASFASQSLWSQPNSATPPADLQITRGAPAEAQYLLLEQFVIRPDSRAMSEHDLLNRARERAQALGATMLFYETFPIHAISGRLRSGLPAVSTCLNICNSVSAAVDYDYRYWRARGRIHPLSYGLALRGWAVVKRQAGSSD